MKAESGNYLIEQAGDHPLLTAEEERDLSRTYRKGSAAQAKLARARSPQTKASLQKLVARGEEARQRMISSNIKLVVSTTARYLWRFDPVSNGGIGLDDAIQDGILGLMRAVEDYDPELGWRFSTYATWWIRQFVQRGIDNAGPTIRIPVHMADRRRLIKRVREQLQK
ncbi:MAG: sigma-70 family RNA polymerase sigma factor, partial [Patescibacteria group bacterium]